MTVFHDRKIVFQSTKIAAGSDVQFSDEWNKFVEVCGLSGHRAVLGAAAAQNDLVGVFSFAHDGLEANFSKRLFNSLTRALGGEESLEELSASDCGCAFAIKGRSIGLVLGLVRGSLGFSKGYTASGDSECDHSVVVFRTPDANFRLRTYDQRDVTASIELKMGNTDCREFQTDSRGRFWDKPDLAGSHGSFGQTILYALDSMHCLTRRGINASQLSLTVVATTRKRGTGGKSSFCCVDGTLNVPQEVGEYLSYSVTSQVPFNPSTGSSETAAALYIRTLREGMEYAVQIELEHQNRPALPSSLCGATACGRSNFQFEGVKATGVTLIASPIPGAEILKNGWSVHQGELFSCDSVTFSGNALLFSGASQATNVLIKVSSAPVHNALVPIITCALSLQRLCFSRDTSLKREIGKVLIAAAFNGRGTLVTVMQDLSQSLYPESHPISASARAGFKVLNHREIQDGGKAALCSLWGAFQTLVETVLLPLAQCDIIHMDIRPGWKKTYNVVHRETDVGMELRLIDFESLTVPWKGSVRNDPAISCSDVAVFGELSAHSYLWWQILWMAFVWQHRGTSGEEPPNSSAFVLYLFDESYDDGDAYRTEFKDFVGDNGKWFELSNMRQNGVKGEAEIRRSMNILYDAFLA
jgi:hypothetical protein